MQSYLISILVACVEPIIIYGEGDNWDYEYQWVCEDKTVEGLQIKAYQELPYTKTETIDLFNRFPVSEVSGEQQPIYGNRFFLSWPSSFLVWLKPPICFTVVERTISFINLYNSNTNRTLLALWYKIYYAMDT